eukprot:GDKJ01013810.1.p1 GENE.GDKJ01013810.1~~GDKJ01013810.1.p1  ORF type:complete len:354 (+),score=38.53 GDKJ01013810.1:105-1166(+)
MRFFLFLCFGIASESRKVKVSDGETDLDAANMSGSDQFTQGKCLRTYLEFCPVHWMKEDQISSTIICRPPSDYKGACVAISTINKSKQQKQDLERDCEISWPCTNDVEVDTEQDELWSKLKTKQSQQTYAVGDYSAGLKCNKRNYNYICPLGYQINFSSKSCLRENASGSCREFLYSDATTASKRQFAAACKTNWPCEDKCSSIFTYCPLEWSVDVQPDGDISCNPPENYTPPSGSDSNCPTKAQSFQLWTPEMRMWTREKCSLNWGCRKGDCQEGMDLTAPCPTGWEKKIDSAGRVSRCVLPPQREDNLCKQREFTDVNSEENKAEFVERCGEVWPCKSLFFPFFSFFRTGM